MQLYNKRDNLKQRKLLRYNQTDAERKFWNLVRGRRLENFKFRRQFAVGSYILDFYCSELRLCVEIDGGQHADDVIRDQNRTDYLNKAKIKVIRFWNNDILKNPVGVYDELLRVINDLTLPSP